MLKRSRSGPTPSNRGNYAETITNFYENRIPSTPDGDLIDVMHVRWRGNYDRLEDHHGASVPAVSRHFPVISSMYCVMLQLRA